MLKKSFDFPDIVKTLDKTHAATVELGPYNATKLVLEPGWRWSRSQGLLRNENSEKEGLTRKIMSRQESPHSSIRRW